MTSKSHNKIQQSYNKGIQDALEKISGWGDIFKGNKNRNIVNSNSGGTGNMKSNLGNLFGGGAAKKPAPVSPSASSSDINFGSATASANKRFSN